MSRSAGPLLLAMAVLLVVPTSAPALRPIPDTSRAVHVWDDQLPDSMSAAQIAFMARRVDGTQKVSVSTARRLRAVKPGFLVLHYRLGIGDGPVPFRIGSRWASDFPFVRHHDSWFWHIGARRVLQRRWDWWLMNPDSGWRAYWASRVLYEARLLGDDGVFADSLSVPQYLGADSFSPPLRYFVGEGAWTARVDRFMSYERARLRGRLWLIPNAGSWITTRDRTDYALADGVMIEGFAEGGPSSFYAVSDWRLQLNRVLGLVRRGRVVIAQSYLAAGDVAARGFVLASYLLVRGSHTFLNMDIGQVPQWFPEYGVALGPALGPVPARVDALRASGGLYVRSFVHGWAVVNPGTSAGRWRLPTPARLVRPIGGGAVPADGRPRGWRLGLRSVSGSVTVPAHGGVVLLR